MLLIPTILYAIVILDFIHLALLSLELLLNYGIIPLLLSNGAEPLRIR